jgi:hypothetical protein
VVEVSEGDEGTSAPPGPSRVELVSAIQEGEVKSEERNTLSSLAMWEEEGSDDFDDDDLSRSDLSGVLIFGMKMVQTMKTCQGSFRSNTLRMVVVRMISGLEVGGCDSKVLYCVSVGGVIMY